MENSPGPIETAVSPLDGNEIISSYGLEPGPDIGKLKEHLTARVIDGILSPDDKDAAHDELQRIGYKRIDTI
jgi:hypothetical protein